MLKRTKFLLICFFILLSIFAFSQQMIRVNVNSNPSGANWKIIGTDEIATTPITAKFRYGETYQIIFTKMGYNAKTITYIGGTGDIFVNLETDGPAIRTTNNILSINSNLHGAIVFINGQQYGVTPFSQSFP